MRVTSPTSRRPRPPWSRLVAQLLVALVASAVLAFSPTGPDPAGATTPPDETLLTLPPTDQPATTDNDFLDLERDLSDCVGSALPKPGCGREPTHSGDRGSPMQWSVFGVMFLGLGFIGWRIVAAARRSGKPSPT